MTAPAYSVVIPAWNEEIPLGRLLERLSSSRLDGVEVIVVSDGSTDGTEAVAAQAGARVLRTTGRRGPAAARNLGARAARAPFLVFLDADVVPEPGLLERVDAHRAQTPELRCFTGVYAREPAVDGWFQRYRALLNHSYHASLPVRGESTLFVTAVAGIDKALFEELGGFDESESAREVEDTELGYRILQRTAIHLLRDVEVQHHFPSFAVNLVNYYRRSAGWVRLFRGRQRFDNHTTTGSTAALRLLGAGVAVATGAALGWPPLWPAAIALHGAYLVANRRFFTLLVRHAPVRELPRMYAADLCLGLAVMAGAARGAVDVALSLARGRAGRRASAQT